jgi:hypothetical protein
VRWNGNEAQISSWRPISVLMAHNLGLPILAHAMIVSTTRVKVKVELNGKGAS